ncbi:MAG: hypothetical protein IT198_11025 [Acidimicrobiia bacterium]|nr:hypothetical protein [Acidimicrobiia bacterium]
MNGSGSQAEVLRPVSPPAPQAVDVGVDQVKYRSRARRWPTSALPAGGPKALPPAGVDARDLTDPSRRPQQDWMPRRNLFYAAPPRHVLAPDAVIGDPRATIRTEAPAALEAEPDASWVKAAVPAVPAVPEAQAYAPPVPPHNGNAPPQVHTPPPVPPHNGIAPPQVHTPPPETQWVPPLAQQADPTPLATPPLPAPPLPAPPLLTVPPADTSAPPPVPPGATPGLAPPAPPVAPLPPRPPASDLHVPTDAQWTLRPDGNAFTPLDTAWAQPVPQPTPAPPDATWTLPAQAPGPAAWSSSAPLDTPLTPAGPVPLDAPVAGPRSFPKSPPRDGTASRRSLLVRVALITACVVAVLALGWWLLAGRGGGSPASPEAAVESSLVTLTQPGPTVGNLQSFTIRDVEGDEGQARVA